MRWPLYLLLGEYFQSLQVIFYLGISLAILVTACDPIFDSESFKTKLLCLLDQTHSSNLFDTWGISGNKVEHKSLPYLCEHLVITHLPNIYSKLTCLSIDRILPCWLNAVSEHHKTCNLISSKLIFETIKSKRDIKIIEGNGYLRLEHIWLSVIEDLWWDRMRNLLPGKMELDDVVEPRYLFTVGHKLFFRLELWSLLLKEFPLLPNRPFQSLGQLELLAIWCQETDIVRLAKSFSDFRNSGIFFLVLLLIFSFHF